MKTITDFKTIIDLNNNYYLRIVNDINNLPIDATDIENLKLINVLKKKFFLIKIDFNNLNKKQYKKVLKKLLFITKMLSKSKIKIGITEESKILLGYIINYDENNKQQSEFILAISAIFYNTRYERYNYIYDTVCDYLDTCFYGKNLCDFENNKCGEKRNTSCNVGCCRHFKNKKIGPFLPNNKWVICEYLKDKRCTAKCISCKLFTCGYLKKKGITFKLKNIFLIDTFFNPIQKYFIKYKVFTPKDKIIKLLLFWS